MKLLITIVNLVLITCAGLTWHVAVAAENYQAPKFKPVDMHKPMAMAKPNQKVAVFKVALSYENGEVVSAKLRKSKIVNSVAPKVFARQSGDWQVMIGDNQNNVFYVNDPGFLEAENKPNDKVPYHYVLRGNEVNWNLIVPLYRNGRSIDASSITVKRVKDGKVIFKTKL